MEACDSILQTLRTRLADSFSIRQAGRACLIETPFSYPDNRVLTIVVSTLDSGDLELSDDGYAHSYARLSGVSNEILKEAATDLAERFRIDASHGEVVATTPPDDIVRGLVALIEASQGIADTVARKRLREAVNRLDRQITTTLVLHNRTYIPRGKIPVGSREIDVDYNVLPTDIHRQLRLFTVGRGASLRKVESMVYRINQIRHAPEAPGYSNRVLLISDESGAFQDRERWTRIRDTLRDAEAKVVPITNSSEIDEWLTA